MRLPNLLQVVILRKEILNSHHLARLFKSITDQLRRRPRILIPGEPLLPEFTFSLLPR